MAKKKQVVSPEEAALIAQAERAKKQGFGESSKPFKVEEEMQAMEDVGMVESSDLPPVSDPVAETKDFIDKVSSESDEEAEFREMLESRETPEEKAARAAQLLNYISPGKAPSAEMILNWKQQFPDLYVLPLLALERGFIYRSLGRQEMIQIVKAESQLDQDQMEEQIFKRCVLWPKFSNEQILMAPAGLIPLVVQEIRIHSCFLDPQAVADLVIKI